jgi:predicted nucleotidyltransferase
MDRKNTMAEALDQKHVIEIGRNFVFLLKRSNFPVIRAFLYGSYAKGIPRKDSDIDLALFMYPLINQFDTQVEMLKLTWDFDTRIEPHPFNIEEINQKVPVIQEILRTGIEITT